MGQEDSSHLPRDSTKVQRGQNLERVEGGLAGRNSLKEPVPLQGVYWPHVIAIMRKKQPHKAFMGRGLYFLRDLQ